MNRSFPYLDAIAFRVCSIFRPARLSRIYCVWRVVKGNSTAPCAQVKAEVSETVEQAKKSSEPRPEELWTDVYVSLPPLSKSGPIS